ncbi:MAG: hypothetical protein DMF77_16695 [Acidobacteria bacterium]|nr:MAG: hypothetical protein DMF77_16695 [Acidobacteriota bacterium]
MGALHERTRLRSNLAVLLVGLLAGLGLVAGLAKLLHLDLGGRLQRLRAETVRPDGAPVAEGVNVQAAETVAYVYDNRCGWKLAPYVQIHRAIGGLFDVRNRTNSEGFLDREHALRTDYFRIAFVGDSLTEAQQVDMAQRFSERTEEYVYTMSQGNKAVEVMNFGTSSWGTAHEYGAIKHFVLKYRPDEVWIFFFSGNDVGDNSTRLNGPPMGPTYVYAPDGALKDVLFGWTMPPPVTRGERSRGKAEMDHTEWDLEVWPFMFTEARSPIMDGILGDTRKIFRLTRDLVASQGSRLRVVYLPSGWEINAPLFERSASEWRARNPSLTDLDARTPERKISAMMAELGIPFLSTTPLSLEYGKKMTIDHYSPFGHERIAEVLAKYVLDNCEVPPLATARPDGR